MTSKANARAMLRCVLSHVRDAAGTTHPSSSNRHTARNHKPALHATRGGSVHDYVDTLVPVLARMHKERRNAYATLGFDVPPARRRNSR